MMPSGLVLTGGGALLPGMKEFAQEIFGVPVRIGMVRMAHDLPESLRKPNLCNRVWVTQAGDKATRTVRSAHIGGPALTRIFMRMKSWVIDFF